MKTTLVVAQHFPPKMGGSPNLIRNLFKHFPERSYSVLTEVSEGPFDGRPPLSCRVYHCRFSHVQRRLDPYCKLVTVPTIVRTGLRAIETEAPDSLFAQYPHAGFFIAGYYLHAITRLPLYVYMHDTWEELRPLGFNTKLFNALLPRIYESRILRAAKCVFAITPRAVELYKEKYGDVTIEVLPHSVDFDISRNVAWRQASQPSSSQQDVTRILFVGDVYRLMNASTLAVFSEVVAEMPDFRLQILSRRDPEFLRALGVDLRGVDVRRGTQEEVFEAQRQVDILYLPLAFDSIAPKEIATVFSTKAVEYLLANTPILVHAPADSYTAEYARECGWGYVVDTLEPRDIETALRELASNGSLRKSLIRNALRAAHERDSLKVSKRLQGWLLDQ